MARRRLMIVAAGLPPAFTGGTPRLKRWAMVLPSLGWDVTVVGFSGRGYWSGSEPDLVGVDSVCVGIGKGEATVAERVQLRICRVLGLKRFPSHLSYFIPRLCRAVKDAAERNPPDVVMVTVPDQALLDRRLLLTLQSLLPGRVVVDARDPFLHRGVHYGRKPSETELERMRAFLREAAMYTDGLAAVNLDTPSEWQECGFTGSCRIVPNSFLRRETTDPDWPGRSRGVFEFCYSGMLSGVGRMDILIPGFKIAVARRPKLLDSLKVRFVGWRASQAHLGDWSVVGSGVLSEDPPVAYEVAKRMMMDADVLLLPRNDKGQVQHLPGGKMYEYMGARRPVLAVACGAPAQLTRDCQIGLTARPDDPEGIAEAILKLYGMWERDEPFPFGPLSLIEPYEVTSTARTLIALFEEVIARSGSRGK